MRPRNKTERRVVELSATLPTIRQYDVKRIADDYERNYGSGITYYLILERCKEFQVIRYYYKTSRSLFEFMQIWLNEDSKVVLAKNRLMRVDGWVRDSEMTIKYWINNSCAYSYLGGVERIPFSGCFIRSLLPNLKRAGLKTSTHGIHPFYLCDSLLHNDRLITLLKLRQYMVVNYYAGRHILDNVEWQAIRVALRHGYSWNSYQDFSDWVDMLHYLNYLELDTRNPYYICPANLHDAHDHWFRARRKKQDKEAELRELQEAIKYEPTFHENRERFLDLIFKSKHVEITVIPTAKAIIEEGKAMHHCVGGYYNEKDSLILTAKVDGKRMETIEVSLADYTLVQSRGLQNKYTKYHGEIVELIKKNLSVIRERDIKRKTA